MCLKIHQFFFLHVFFCSFFFCCQFKVHSVNSTQKKNFVGSVGLSVVSFCFRFKFDFVRPTAHVKDSSIFYV